MSLPVAEGLEPDDFKGGPFQPFQQFCDSIIYFLFTLKMIIHFWDRKYLFLFLNPPQGTLFDWMVTSRDSFIAGAGMCDDCAQLSQSTPAHCTLWAHTPSPRTCLVTGWLYTTCIMSTSVSLLLSPSSHRPLKIWKYSFFSLQENKQTNQDSHLPLYGKDRTYWNSTSLRGWEVSVVGPRKAPSAFGGSLHTARSTGCRHSASARPRPLKDGPELAFKVGT